MKLITQKFLPHIVLTTAVAAVLSCGSENKKAVAEKEEIKEERILFSDKGTDSLLVSLRDSPATFAISNTTDTAISCKSGVTVHVPANVFVDENNKPVGNVDIEVLEAISPSDFLFNGLQTTSNGEILQSGGMFFINAQSNGKPVSLKSEESLIVQVPAKMRIGGMGVFYGNYSDNGELNWTSAGKSTGTLDNNIVAIPLEILDFGSLTKDNWLLNGKQYIKQDLQVLNDPKFEGTYIASEEFKGRLSLLLFGTLLEKDTTVLSKLLNVYTSNINKNLYEADSLAIELLQPRYDIMMKELEDSSKQVKNSNDFAESFAFAIIKASQELIPYFWNVATDFKNERLTKPLDFTELKITAETTKQDLLARGYSATEANLYLLQYRQQQSKIAQIQNREEGSQKQKELQDYTIAVNKLGWVNIDRFLDDPTCKESDFVIEVTNADSAMNIHSSLIFPVNNICIKSIYSEGFKYGFTQKGGSMRKLPIDQKAIAIVLATKNNKTFVAIKDFKVPETGVIPVELHESSMENIKAEISETIKKQKKV